MRSPDEIDFDQFYEDWRHRDRLTWQIPSVVVVIAGALIISAYATELCWQIRSLVFGLGTFFAATMTAMLAQNLYYQWRDEENLDAFGKGLALPRSRPIPPTAPPEQKDDTICTKLARIVRSQRMGSTLLLICCFIVSVSLFGLFVTHSIIIGHWWPAIAICVAIILLTFGWFLSWLKWGL